MAPKDHRRLRRAYEELKETNRVLEEKIHLRTHELVEANERLREVDVVKSNFISMVSHELRTPLTSIKAFVVTFMHFWQEFSREKRQMYLNILNDETDRLTRLITELLDISRIESGRIEMEWQKISLPTMVSRVFKMIAPKAEGIRLMCDFPADFPDVLADPSKMEQVLFNLVENSVRYSPPRSTVVVVGRRERDGLMLQVRDEGPGIPFDQLERIFDKFHRLDTETNQKNPGTGLGLPICRAWVNLHGGKIWAESELGRGSRFILTLPLNLDKHIVTILSRDPMRQAA